jgi:hypothetical protein
MMMVRLHPTVTADSKIYLDGNFYQKHCADMACLGSPSAQWRLAIDPKWDWEHVSVRATAPPLSLTNLPLSSVMAYSEVEPYLTANSGARPLDRDAVDSRIIKEIASRTGSVPNNPSEKAGPGTGSDGFPILAVNKRTLVIPANPNEVVDAVGRTRIEEWLETMARELEPARKLQGTSAAPPVAPTNVRLAGR